jgi:hypothetical protein
MAELDDLVAAAAKADKQDRISWRNQIAEYGPRAIPTMHQWLTDPHLGAFAVRVLERVAEQPGDRQLVVESLVSVSPTTVSPAVARDMADALERLSVPRGRGSIVGGSRSAPVGWSGYPTASPLEKRFHDDMLDIFRMAGEATRKQRSDGTFIRGYWASYFLRGVRNHGGLAYAHQLLIAEGTSDGFARLTEEGRLDLTVEALVLRPEYQQLFSEHERQIAASRLARGGYQRPER